MIGVALIKECLKNDTLVVAVVRPGSANLHRVPQNEMVRIVECDSADIALLPSMLDVVFDCFYHLAWDGTSRALRDDVLIHERNITHTLVALKSAHAMGCPAFVGAGSQAEYGRVSDMIAPDTPANPEYAYGIAKLAAGRLCQQYCAHLGMRFVWGRIFSVYGEYDSSDTMVMYMIRTLLAKKVPDLTACEQMWDYLYCSDAGRAFYLMGETGNGFYCVGSGRMRPLVDYVTAIRNAIDKDLSLRIGKRPYAPQQVMRLCADIKKLSDDTGFAAQTDFETGIANTVKWFKEENAR